jgi:hypothetical protein
MGGLYSTLAQSHQRYVITRFVTLHEESDESLPELPEGVVSLSVVTGIDALGRSSELEALMTGARMIKEVIPPEAIAQELNVSDFIRRVFAALGIKPDGLIKSRQQRQQEAEQQKQDATNQTLLEETAGPIAQAGANGLAKAALSQLPQNQPQQ